MSAERDARTPVYRAPDTDADDAPAVYTSGKLRRVPNQPKTPHRSVRVPDELWEAAMATAAARGESLSDIIRDALARYVKRNAHKKAAP